MLFFWLFSIKQDVVEKNFVQLTYTDAVELLLKAKKKFEFPVLMFLSSESADEKTDRKSVV